MKIDLYEVHVDNRKNPAKLSRFSTIKYYERIEKGVGLHSIANSCS